jgi:nitroimidazol reductase NimA-like FMN-containing flavoprotein (pyridoxamine 5'-phosphate oxidase superfamily)
VGQAQRVESDPRNGMTILDAATCWALLGEQEVGRLAVAVGSDPEIFPINYTVVGERLLFRTAEGTKLAFVAASARVAFEIDGYDPSANLAWSVVVKGDAEILEHFEDIYAAEDAPLFPWNAAPKQWFVRVTPREVHGRRFTVVARDDG